MPGIVGIISREPSAACRGRLAAMVKSMQHQPHYQSATCEAPEMGVYAGWVAHPGSFAALESGSGEGGATELVFAGEYSRESGRSLLQMYERRGENWVVELNGLFSGLLIDRRSERAFLFNDRYGVERVYVHEAEDATYFASEAKALLCVLPATRSFDDEGVAEFLTVGCPIEGRTLFRRIRLLDGGSVWTFDGGPCRKKTYFTPAEWESQPPLSAEDFQAEFQSKFKSALPRYLASDSRIGISLTGGLDTRMIMACLPALSTPPVCYTFTGVHGHTLDARIAAQVASECGLEHRLLRIQSDFLSDFAKHVDHTVYTTDGCAGAVGAHEIYLNAQARQLAPTRLTGNFGSEILRGMSTFKPLGLSPQLFAPDFAAQIHAAAQRQLHGTHHPVTFAAFREIPQNLFGTMAAAKSQVTFRTPYLDNDLVALTYRAPAAVRQTTAAAAGLVCNANPRLAEIATDRAVQPNGRGVAQTAARLLAESTFKLDYLYFEALPTPLLPFDRVIGSLRRIHLLGRHKYLPYRAWFRRELASYTAAALIDAADAHVPFFNRRFVAEAARDHVEGRCTLLREINAIITLARAERLLLKPPTFASAATITARDRGRRQLPTSV